MTSKSLYIFTLLIFVLTAEASSELPLMRSMFGFEHITPFMSPEHDYKTTMVTMGTEFNLNQNSNLVASTTFQEKDIPEGVEFKYELLIKHNRFRHKYANAGLLMGYTNSTVAYQICKQRMPEFCRTFKKYDTGAVYGASIDIKISNTTVIFISALKGGQLDLTRLSISLSQPF